MDVDNNRLVDNLDVLDMQRRLEIRLHSKVGQEFLVVLDEQTHMHLLF